MKQVSFDSDMPKEVMNMAERIITLLNEYTPTPQDAMAALVVVSLSVADEFEDREEILRRVIGAINSQLDTNTQ